MPLSTSRICEAIMKARGLDTDDKALCLLMMRRTVANLKHWSVKRGLIRSMPGPGQELCVGMKVAKTVFCHCLSERMNLLFAATLPTRFLHALL